jgi:hypothetical protein
MDPCLHLDIVYTKALPNSLRVDMVIRFQGVEAAIEGKQLLTLADFSTSVPQFIEPGRYFSLITSPEEAAAMNDIGRDQDVGTTSGYTTLSSDRANLDEQQVDEDEDVRVLNARRFGPLGTPPRPSQRSRVIFVGQVPVELLKDVEDIRQRFGKYGPLKDARIRK